MARPRSVGLIVGLVVLTLAGSTLLAVKGRELLAVRGQLAALAGRPAPPAVETTPISDEERRLWAELEERLRRRYPREAELPRAMVAVAEWARAAGLELVTLDVQGTASAPGSPAGPAVGAPPPAGVRVPAELAFNGPRFRLVARHRYRDLVRFVDGLPRLPVYVMVQSIDVRRTGETLTTEMAFATLRWGA